MTGKGNTAASAAAPKKESKLGIEAKKEDDLSTWYTQVLLRAEMMDYHDISGCYILRPWSFSIWKDIQAFLGKEINDMGVEDAYFPLFISQSALVREKDHVEGFAPEVAWVTKSGQTDLAEPIAVRPTSETIMYPAYARWIQSHRDLPMKMNQWCNVVRWEFKHPQPFLRSREFLWQEGHTCFATKTEADQDVLQALELYRRVYEELLAIPVVKGMKSEKEKFAGALYTTTVEAFVPAAGRSIQGGTSHCLGQNFSKMFNITFEGTTGEQEFAWQNSWGLSTRVIGALVMIHSDNNGLVLPPRVASVQVVVMPVGITVKTTEEDRAKIYATVEQIVERLKAAGVRAKADLRDHVTPGWKFNHWELKGVPARFEVGPKDMANNEARVCIRHSGEKFQMSMAEVEKDTKSLMDRIHDELFAKAKAEREGRVHEVTDWDGLMAALAARCSALMPWCEEPSCEDSIKERSTKKAMEGLEVDAKALSMGAKSLCIPFEQPSSCAGKSCVGCGKPAKRWTLFGRSY